MQPALAPAPHPSMQNTAQVQDHADQVLQEQLIAAQQHLSPHSQGARPQQSPHIQAAAARDQNNNIDPAIAGGAMINPTDSQAAAAAAAAAAATPSGQAQPATAPQQDQATAAPEQPRKYGKRELSTSKRAAQNRAAQRAFRQRKEGYIRKLEEQVKEYEVLSESYKALQAENYQLREYIISLQSRLIDSQNEVPELPGNIDLSQPRPEPPTAATSGAAASASAPAPTGAAASTAPTPVAPGQQAQPSAAPSSTPGEDLNQLNRIAVAGLGMRKHQHEEAAYLGNDNNFPAKRMRTDNNNSNSNNSEQSGVTKTEAPNGLSVAT
ncbi:hypothetical protein VTN77DRAFT_9674 [Rasamsonia byssochlamydoides]|uniref:uncharacterized protein n=1 Tax=Rasamsonia byssochlamydoides TaxID=89139 RepID=UPI0037433192